MSHIRWGACKLCPLTTRPRWPCSLPLQADQNRTGVRSRRESTVPCRWLPCHVPEQNSVPPSPEPLSSGPSPTSSTFCDCPHQLVSLLPLTHDLLVPALVGTSAQDTLPSQSLILPCWAQVPSCWLHSLKIQASWTCPSPARTTPCQNHSLPQLCLWDSMAESAALLGGISCVPRHTPCSVPGLYSWSAHRTCGTLRCSCSSRGHRPH